MNTYIVYTYKGDQELLECSIKMLRKSAKDDNVVIIDDAFNPMDKEFYKKFEELNCKMILSTHRRNGNLIGPEHTEYHAKMMMASAPTENDIVIKIDPDTLILNTSFIDSFKKDEDAVLLGAFKQHINYMMGMCYCVKGGEFLQKYYDDVVAYPSWLQSFEDFEVSSRYYRLTERDPFKISRINLLSSKDWSLMDFRNLNPKNFLQLSVFNGGFISKSDVSLKKSMIKAYSILTDEFIKNK